MLIVLSMIGTIESIGSTARCCSRGSLGHSPSRRLVSASTGQLSRVSCTFKWSCYWNLTQHDMFRSPSVFLETERAGRGAWDKMKAFGRRMVNGAKDFLLGKKQPPPTADVPPSAAAESSEESSGPPPPMEQSFSHKKEEIEGAVIDGDPLCPCSDGDTFGIRRLCRMSVCLVSSRARGGQ